MKKLSSLFLTGILAFACLAGCMPKTRLPEQSSGGEIIIDIDKNASGKLTVATKNGNAEEGLVEAVKKVFNQSYPNVEVEIKLFTGDVYPYMMSAVRTETVPDIIISTSFEMFQLNNSRVLMNLQPYIDAETKAGTFDVNDYYDMFMKAGQENFDGDQYLIPRSADRVVCHCNMDIINEANEWYQTSAVYDASKCKNLSDLIVNGWTWNDFEYVCSVIRAWYDQTGRYDKYLLDGYLNWEAVWNPILTSYGTKYIGDDNKVLINSPETAAAIEFMKGLVTKRYTSTTSANFYGGQGVFFFHSQSAKECAEKVGLASKYKEYAEKKEYSKYYNCVTIPVKPGAEAIGAGVAGYVVSAYSKVPAFAWKFLKTLLSQEAQNELSKDSPSNYVPVRKDMADASKWEWGKNMDGINLSAYTYNMGNGDDPDWSCFTDFFLKKPTQAMNLLNTVGAMVNTAVLDSAKGIEISKCLKDCESSMQSFLNMR